MTGPNTAPSPEGHACKSGGIVAPTSDVGITESTSGKADTEGHRFNGY